MEEYIFIGQKVRIMPNKAQINILESLFGKARFIYNLGVEYFNNTKIEERVKLNGDLLKNQYFKSRKNYSFLKDLDPSFENKIFQNLNIAIRKKKNSLKENEELNLKFKKKYLTNSFSLKGSCISITEKTSSTKSFIYFSGLSSSIKIMDKLRFNGIIIQCAFKRIGEKYFASLLYKITKDEYKRSHDYDFLENKTTIGIDLGLKNTITTSCGLVIDAPMFMLKHIKRLKHLHRELTRKSIEKQADGSYKKSNNYIKAAQKLNKFYTKALNKKETFANKVSSILVRNFAGICMEDIELKDLMKKKFFSRKNFDLAMGDIKTRMKNKCNSIPNRIFVEADRFFPSSKRCIKCGNIKEDLNLNNRVYRCDSCGIAIDRDFNAACNLFKYMKNKIGFGTSKLTIAEKDKIINDCIKNDINYSFVEPINVSNSFKNVANQTNSLKRTETIPHI